MINKCFLYFFSVFLLLASGCSKKHPNFEEEIAECAAIQDKDDRLAAFDALSATILKKSANGALKHEVKESSSGGKWNFNSDISPIDDKPIVTIYKEAEEVVQVGYKKIRPQLFIRFKEGSLSCYIVYGIFIGTESTTVTMRMDKKDPRTHKWEISNNHEAIFYPSGVKWFIDNLIASNALLIQLTPHSESTVTTSFDLTGLQEAIKPILSEFEKSHSN